MVSVMGCPFVGVPAIRDGSQRCRVDRVVLAAAFLDRDHEPGRLKHAEVLRDGLTRQGEPVFHRQAAARFEQHLPIPLDELVEMVRRAGSAIALNTSLTEPTIGKC
jgi:hypothetical protein